MGYDPDHVISCPKCNGTMAAVQTERGAFFVCDCGHEVPVSEQGTVEENAIVTGKHWEYRDWETTN